MSREQSQAWTIRSPTTTTFYEVLNSNRILFRATIDSYKSPVLFHKVLTVSAGDTVDFAVDFGQDGNYIGDSVGGSFLLEDLSRQAEGEAVTLVRIDLDLARTFYPRGLLSFFQTCNPRQIPRSIHQARGKSQ